MIELKSVKNRLNSRWTKKEINILKKNYSKIGLKKTVKLLNRTEAAVQSKAHELGLCPSRRGVRKLPNHQAAKNHVFYTYKREAIKRGYSFSLTQNEVENLVKQNCFYCGQKPVHPFRGYVRDYTFICNGIDRLDNNIGYIIDNCVPCCKTCNWMKSTLSYEVFMNHIEKIYKYKKGGD